MSCNNGHMTIYAYDGDRKPLYKSKKGYNSENEALLKCYQLNISPYTIHKAVVYKCSVCGKWHIGHHSNVDLTAEDKEKIRIKFEKFKAINRIK